VTNTRASGSATPAGRPAERSTGASSSARVAPPNAADRKPDSVTPICTADRNRFGWAARLATAAPRLPRVLSARTCESRSDTSAISAAAKIPPTRMNSRISRMLATVGFNGSPWLASDPDRRPEATTAAAGAGRRRVGL